MCPVFLSFKVPLEEHSHLLELTMEGPFYAQELSSHTRPHADPKESVVLSSRGETRVMATQDYAVPDHHLTWPGSHIRNLEILRDDFRVRFQQAFCGPQTPARWCQTRVTKTGKAWPLTSEQVDCEGATRF